jgi:predicted HTH transcriptional regulator
MSDGLIKKLLEQPESQTFEWKRSLTQRDEGLKSLCGMVNTDAANGAIAFGIAPGGKLVGIDPGNLDKAQRSLEQTIGDKFQPRLLCTIAVIEFRGKHFLLVEATRHREVPYHEFDGRAHIREGTVTRQLNYDEKMSLQRKRRRDLHQGPWKCDRCGLSPLVFLAATYSAEGVPERNYKCECGGEYWPA